MAAADQSREPVAVRGVADVLGREGAALDEVEDERAVLPVPDRGREAGRVRRPRRRQLEAADDVVLGDVAADPHEIAAAGVARR